jgi:hypothetical protein
VDHKKKDETQAGYAYPLNILMLRWAAGDYSSQLAANPQIHTAEASALQIKITCCAAQKRKSIVILLL